jgi:hypothetical protein
MLYTFLTFLMRATRLVNLQVFYLTTPLILIIESRWGRDFPCRPDWPRGPPNLLSNDYRVFPGVKAAGKWC